MEDLSLHVMDIVENSIRSGAGRIGIEIVEDTCTDALIIVITDDGAGMTDERKGDALNPFYTSKPEKRIGLGLPLFKQAAEDTGGRLEVSSMPGTGTVVRAEFTLSHPDLKPMGDMKGTVGLLRVFHPEIMIDFTHVLEQGQDS